jgi:hypothetical protein
MNNALPDRVVMAAIRSHTCFGVRFDFQPEAQ